MAAKERAPERPPATATFRFHADLNDFLPAARRGLATVHALPVPTTVKDAIENGLEDVVKSLEKGK